MKWIRSHGPARASLAVVAVLLLAGLAAPPAEAADWPSWRGPQNTGFSPEKGLPSRWTPGGENTIWKADFIGRSTPVVGHGRVCVIGRVGEGIERQEIVACYDAEDGRKLWESRFNVYLSTVPFNRVGWASLALDPDTGSIYAQGVAGQLIAYDKNGTELWRRFLTEEFGRYSGYGGRTQTPVIFEDAVIISFVSSSWGREAPIRHRYFAFDKQDGTLRWVAEPGGQPTDFNTQSVPVVTHIGNQPVIVTGNADGWVYALRAHTGEKIWGFRVSALALNSTVLVDGDRVYASHSEENVDGATMGRLVAIDGTGTGDVTKTHELWRIDELEAGFPSPAYHEGTLYVVDNSANLFAVDAETGRARWQHSLGTVGKASPVVADGKLYIGEVNGRVHILEPGKDGVKQLDLDEVHVADGRYAEIYGSFAVAYGRLFLATEGGLYAIGDPAKPFRVDPDPRPDPPKRVSGGGEPGSIRLVPADVVLESGASVAFEVRAFDALGRPLGARGASFALDDLGGTLQDGGRYVAPADGPADAGYVVATLGEATSRAAVRVFPALPWLEDFEARAVGTTPEGWIDATGKYLVAELEGRKVLHKPKRERGLDSATIFIGPTAMSGYTIQADVMGQRAGRRAADVGLVNSGYSLDLQGAHQRLEVRSWPSERRMAQSVAYAWEPGVWYRLKMRVEADAERAIIRGKVWPNEAAEPEAWTITVEDPLPIRNGSPGLVTYAPLDAYYDNLRVFPNE